MSRSDGQYRECDEDDPDGASADRDDEHLADVPDGAGCTEIWEHLAERREDETDG